MSTAGNLHQLQSDLHEELITANQLLRAISLEVKKIVSLTNTEGKLETNIQKNANLITTLSNMKQIDISNLPPVQRSLNDVGP